MLGARILILRRDFGPPSQVDNTEGKGNGQGHHDFSTKKLIILQCFRLEPFNLDGMLVFTSRWP